MDFTSIRDDETDDDFTEDLAQKPGCLLRFARVFLVVAILLLAGAWLVPVFLSSASGLNWAVGKINARIAPAQISVGQWSLGWFSAPVLDRVTYSDASKGVTANAEQVVFDKGLLRLLPVGTLNLGTVTVKKPGVVCSSGGFQPPASQSGGGFQPLNRRQDTAATLFLPIVDISGTFVLEQGWLTISGINAYTFSVQHLDATVVVPSFQKPVGVTLRAQVENGPVSLEGHLMSLSALTTKKDAEPLTFELKSPWIHASAKGTLNFGAKDKKPTGELNATAEADLSAIVRDFGPILGLSPEFTMPSGCMRLGLSVNANEKDTGIEGALVTQDLRMRFAGEPLALNPAPSLVLKASMPHDGVPEIGELKIAAPFANVSASGRLDNAKVKGFVNLTAFSRDFRRVFKSLPPMVGEINFDADTQPANGDVITVITSLKAKDLALELKPNALMIVPQGTLNVTGAFPSGEPFSEFRDAKFDLTVNGGSAKGGCKRVTFATTGSAPRLEGFSVSSEFEFTALRRLIGAFLPEAFRTKTAGWTGQFIMNATAEAANGTIKARVNAAGQNLSSASSRLRDEIKIPDIRLSGTVSQEKPDGDIRAETEITGSGALLRGERAVFAENGAKLKSDLLIAPGFSRVKAKSFDLKSNLLDIQGSADATELQSRCVVAAQGKLTVNCESVTRLLDAQGIDEWTLTGREARNFTFKAPMAGGLDTLFAEGEIDAAVFIKSLKGMGLDAGASDLSVKLSRSRMKVAYTPPLNNGKLKCVPEFTLERGNLTCVLPPKTRLLENVRVTQGAMDILLINVFPVFKSSIVQDGTATLDVANFKYVHGLTPDKGLAADTTLQLKNARLTLGPTMREILTMLKIKSHILQAPQLTVHTVTKDGRTHILPVRVVIEKQPMTFCGWVAFNGDISYQIEIPVNGKPIKLPVTGTVDAPKIETLALTKALVNVVSEAVIEEAADRINDFLDNLKKEFKSGKWVQ